MSLALSSLVLMVIEPRIMRWSLPVLKLLMQLYTIIIIYIKRAIYRQSGPLQSIEHQRWSPDMSAPQHIGVRAPTGRLSGVREQTCRLPSKLSLGSRQVGCLAFGSRPVGSPEHFRSGADRSVPQKIAVGGPTCRLPRHCH